MPDCVAIVSSWRDQLHEDNKSLVGNRGYRKYPKGAGPHPEIDEATQNRGPLRRQVGVANQHATAALKYQRL